jgi:cyclophilin family peptidyl-prolyl cis-trans isomerase
MRARGLVLALVLLSPALAGCVNDATANPIEPCGELEQSFEPAVEHNPRLKLETTNGTMTVALHAQQVPLTANHVRRIVNEEVWEDTRFHYIFPSESLFGGDPRSASEDRQAWGSGGYPLTVADEHHQFLRHDEAGVMSLLSPRPNQADSQFVITLAPQPGLDDRNSVFGEVVAGMDTARELAQTPTDDQNRPLYGAYLRNASLERAPEPAAPPPEPSAYGFDCTEVAEPGEEAEHLVALRNTGQSILNGSLETSVDDEAGWDVSLRNANASQFAVPSGQTVAYPVNVSVPEDAERGTEHTVELRFTSNQQDVETSLELTTRVGQLGDPATDKDQVEVRYVGVLEDGRAFQATETVYTEDGSVSWFNDPPAEPEPITLDSSEHTQFGDLLQRANLSETVVGSFPSQSQTYGEQGLGGRLLTFQVYVSEA